MALGRKGLKALVVDDNPTQRYVLTRVVEQAGYDFLEAQTGEEALEMLAKDVAHVIIADVKLPMMDGFELCRHIKSDGKAAKIPVILVTSMYYTSDREGQEIAKGKRKAKDVGATELFPRGEALQQLPGLLATLARRA